MPIRDIPKQTFTLDEAGTSYSEIIDMADKAVDEIEATINVISTAGTDLTINITPQYSYDQVKWFDAPSASRFTEIDEDTADDYAETLEFSVGIYFRFKIVVAGTDIDAVIDLYSCGKSK